MNNLEFAKAIQQRTMNFAVEVIRLFVRLPKTDDARVPGRQLLRSATSVAANYRAACRAKSQADFISKMGTVVEEADETAFWMDLMEKAEIVTPEMIGNLRKEADEFLRMFSASLHTAKSNSRNNASTH